MAHLGLFKAELVAELMAEHGQVNINQNGVVKPDIRHGTIQHSLVDMLLDKDKTLMVLAKVTVPEAAEVVGMVDIPQPMERDLRVPVVLVTHIKI